MHKTKLIQIMDFLKTQYKGSFGPLSSKHGKGNFPFRVLISTIISLRTKDAVTARAAEQLFSLADGPYDMQRLTEKKIQNAIYPAGFYKTKSRTIHELAKFTVKNMGKVPDTMDGLLALKGVGRKTANLVISEGFGKPGLCVDTHVHRISNRFGLVKTKTPKQTEFDLRIILPKKDWRGYSTALVAHGQKICSPVSPKCSKCGLAFICGKVGVEKHR